MLDGNVNALLTSDMAMASPATPKYEQERKIAACLNSLLDINLGGIAPNYDLTGFIADYFLEDDCDDEQDTFFDETDEEFDGKLFVGGD